jgi:hypothetical protein
MELIIEENIEKHQHNEYDENSIKESTSNLSIYNPPLEYENVETSWNDSIEKTVKNIGEMAKMYKLMHIHTAQKSYKIYNTYMYLSICVGPMVGVLSTIDSIISDDSTSKITTMLITFLSFFSGILATIIKFGKFEEESSANKLAASRYLSLENNVRRQLSMFRKDRINAKSYVEWLSKSFDELFLASPLISNEINKIYLEKAEKKGIKMIRYDDNIEVSEEYEKNIMNNMNSSKPILIRKNNESIEENKNQKLKKKIKRNVSFIDVEKYDDSRMKYEMKRFLSSQS